MWGVESLFLVHVKQTKTGARGDHGDMLICRKREGAPELVCKQVKLLELPSCCK